MAPTPYTPNGKLRIQILITAKIRNVDIPVNIGFSAGEYVVSTNWGTPAFDTPEDVGQAFWDLFKVEYPSGVPAASFVLYERLDNIFVPRASGDLTGAGTGTGTVKLGTQLTITFKDDDQHLQRLQLPETIEVSPQHLPISSVGGGIAAIIDGYLEDSVAGSLGQWVVTRANQQPTRAIFVSTSENFKFKRDRGI